MSAKTFIILLVGMAAALALSFFIGRSEGRRQAATECSALTITDTLWREVHDTAFVEVESLRTIVRHDTVMLATVSKMESVGATAESSSVVHDTIEVAVPIERKVFEGDRWRVTATGYHTDIEEVYIRWPQVTTERTITKTKRWAFTAGAQVGYGMTLHGGSPYIGLGFGFGYVF